MGDIKMTNYTTYKGKKYAIYGWHTLEGFANIIAKGYNRDNPKRHAIVIHSGGKYLIITRKK